MAPAATPPSRIRSRARHGYPPPKVHLRCHDPSPTPCLTLTPTYPGRPAPIHARSPARCPQEQRPSETQPSAPAPRQHFNPFAAPGLPSPAPRARVSRPAAFLGPRAPGRARSRKASRCVHAPGSGGGRGGAALGGASKRRGRGGAGRGRAKPGAPRALAAGRGTSA